MTHITIYMIPPREEHLILFHQRGGVEIYTLNYRRYLEMPQIACEGGFIH